MDLIITTNGPGEVSTWVKPILQTIRCMRSDVSITVFLLPCMFASGREEKVIRGFESVDHLITPAESILYRLTGKKPCGFDPGKKGAVLHLGGDLHYAYFLGRKLHYKVYAYCERAAGHPKNLCHYFVDSLKTANRFIAKGIEEKNISLAGRLLLDAVKPDKNKEYMYKLLGLNRGMTVLNLFPGSRPWMIEFTLPFLIKTIEAVKRDIVVLITLAPYIRMRDLENCLKRNFSEDWELIPIHSSLAELRVRQRHFMIYQGNQYDVMQVTDLAVALPGSSNFELAAMGVPVLVFLPLHAPEKIPLPGVLNSIGRIPLAGKWVKSRLIIPRILKKMKFVSPVNKAYEEELLPEFKGVFSPRELADRLLKLLDSEIEPIRKKLELLHPKGTGGHMLDKLFGDMEDKRE